MKYISLFLLLFCSVLNSFGQYGFAVDGYIVDQSTGSPITGARVSINKGGIETFSNRYGYYSISVPANKIMLYVEYQGFKSDTFALDIQENVQMDIELKAYVTTSATHFQITTASQNVLSDPQGSKIDVPISTLTQIPYLFSENDVVKGLQMFPGVSFGPDGFSDLFVRGGDVGQNLMLLDGTPVYSQGHLFGYISNFNTVLVNNIQLYKGAFPARYGGRISSVVDITSTSGTREEVQGSLTISPILANLNIVLPIDEKGSSLAFTWRRSYIDLLLGIALGNSAFRFGDFQSKLDLKVTDRDVVSLSFYNLSDKLNFSFSELDTATNNNVTYDLGIEDKNRTVTLRWNRNHNSRLFSSVSGSYSGLTHLENFTENNSKPLPGNPARIKNDVKFYMGDIALNVDLEYNRSNQHFLRYGSQNIMHMFLPGQLTTDKFSTTNVLTSSEVFGENSTKNSLELAMYVEDEFRSSKKMKFNLGFRNVVYAFDNKTTLYPEPRLSGRYLIDSISSFKFGFMRVNQFLHLYNNGSTESEVIVWIPADEILAPEGSNQLTFSYARKVKEHVEWQTDAYYKTMENQIIFYSIDYFDSEAFGRNALVGTGTAYGLENFLKYTYNDVSAWFSYTLAVSNRTFDDLNRGEAFFQDYDRRHMFKSSFVYNMDQFIFSANMIMSSGNPFTLPSAKYRDLDGRLILSYDQINNYRSSTYFRTDIKFQYFWGTSDDFNHNLELTIYNVTAARNVSNIYSTLDTDFANQKYKAMKESNFLFFPSLSYKLII